MACVSVSAAASVDSFWMYESFALKLTVQKAFFTTVIERCCDYGFFQDNFIYNTNFGQ